MNQKPNRFRSLAKMDKNTNLNVQNFKTKYEQSQPWMHLDKEGQNTMLVMPKIDANRNT